MMVMKMSKLLQEKGGAQLADWMHTPGRKGDSFLAWPEAVIDLVHAVYQGISKMKALAWNFVWWPHLEV